MTKEDDRLELAMTRIQQRLEIERAKGDANPGLIFFAILMMIVPGLGASTDLSDPIGCLRDVRELVDALIESGES